MIFLTKPGFFTRSQKLKYAAGVLGQWKDKYKSITFSKHWIGTLNRVSAMENRHVS